MKSFTLATVAGLAATAAASAVTLFDNGPLATGATTQSGVAAPAGFQWSEVADRGAAEPGVSNTSAGFTQTGGFRLADDFTIGAGQSWTVNSVRVFGYLTGSASTTQPYSTGATMRIWSGRPGDVGSTIVFGDATTNVMTATGNTNLFRTFNSTVPPPGTVPGTTRLIRFLDLNAGGLVLGAGTYWVDWGAIAAAGFSPNVTIPHTGTLPGWNGRQFNPGTSTWTDMIDTANPDPGADLVQAMAFIVDGVIPAPGAAALFGVAGLAGLRRRR